METVAVRTARFSLPLVGVAFVLWLALRGLEFASGFVEPSLVRAVLALAAFAPVLLPLLEGTPLLQRLGSAPGVTSLLRSAESVLSRRAIVIGLLLALTVLGHLVFVSRDMRGADMGDDPLWWQSIETTARFEGVLYNDLSGGGSQLRAHGNYFLFLFVPLVWIFGGSAWYIVHFLYSAALVVALYLTARLVVSAMTTTYKATLTWLLTVALFLAMYVYHPGFSDIPFGALGLAVLLTGLFQQQRWVAILGFVGCLLSRETVVLTVFLLVLFLPFPAALRRLKVPFIALSAAGFALSLFFMFSLGGNVSIIWIDPCVFRPNLSGDYVTCVANSLAQDVDKKVAYTLRLVSYGPTALLNPAATIAMLPDAGYVWISRGDAYYNLRNRYSLPPLIIILVFGAQMLARRDKSGTGRWLRLGYAWAVATALFQFATLFRLNLF
jgi:hypothetical protein